MMLVEMFTSMPVTLHRFLFSIWQDIKLHFALSLVVLCVCFEWLHPHYLDFH